jgi:hypothetical protein
MSDNLPSLLDGWQRPLTEAEKARADEQHEAQMKYNRAVRAINDPESRKIFKSVYFHEPEYTVQKEFKV